MNIMDHSVERPAAMERSWLFVPGDSERKMAKAAGNAADILILDLEDAVAPNRTVIARSMVREFLRATPGRARQKLWVRINPLSTSAALADLAGVMPGAPDGILLPKLQAAEEVAQLCHYLGAFEAAFEIEIGRTRIMPVATETAMSMFHLGRYRGQSRRLAGMTWGAEDLATAVGATTNRASDGAFDLTYQLARTLCLLGARAAEVSAIDTITADFRNVAILEREAKEARARGFGGKIAIHPDQVEIINNAFTPSAEEVSEAKRVIEAFTASGSQAGTVGLDGRMLDMPHLKQAQNILAMAEQLGRRG
jgi:citrate lyase subunit beta / citryl-CoA lyase